MGRPWSEIFQDAIKTGESAASKWLVARILAGMGVATTAWYYGLASAVVGAAVGIVIRYGDVLGFMLIDGWQQTATAIEFLRAAEYRANLPAGVSNEARKKAELDELFAFNRLVDMGNSNRNRT